MPLYEYKCHKCGDVFEKIQKFSDDPLTTHEAGDCGGEVERLISSPAIQFKGTGWYVTDYAKSGSTSPKSTGGAEPKAAKTESTKSETKTESKPAATSTSSDSK